MILVLYSIARSTGSSCAGITSSGAEDAKGGQRAPSGCQNTAYDRLLCPLNVLQLQPIRAQDRAYTRARHSLVTAIGVVADSHETGIHAEAFYDKGPP